MSQVVLTARDAAIAARARWTAIATGAGLYALSGPGQTAGFSVFVDPVTEAFGVSRGQLTAAYLVATLLAAPVGWWLGHRLDRQRLATMVRLIGGALAVALLVTAVSPGLAVLTVGVFGLRAFGQSGLSLASSVFVAAGGERAPWGCARLALGPRRVRHQPHPARRQPADPVARMAPDVGGAVGRRPRRIVVARRPDVETGAGRVRRSAGPRRRPASVVGG